MVCSHSLTRVAPGGPPNRGPDRLKGGGGNTAVEEGIFRHHMVMPGGRVTMRQVPGGNVSDAESVTWKPTSLLQPKPGWVVTLMFMVNGPLTPTMQSGSPGLATLLDGVPQFCSAAAMKSR